MSEKAYVQTRHGEVIEVPKAEVRAKLESGEYLPATAADKADADRRAANSTLTAKAKTFAESAAASAIDTVEAPIALPVRGGAALLGYDDPLKDIGGRQTVENAANIFGELKNRLTGTNQSGEAYGRQYGENARARAEANPNTATAGNLVGSIAAGGALSGGASSIGTSAAKALGGGLAARAAGAFAGGALEGAAYDQAGASEEAYLKNIPLSGEKLIASLGFGALLGGTVSLGAEGLGALVRRGAHAGQEGAEAAVAADGLDAGADVPARPGEGVTAADRLRDFADERTGKALGVRASDYKKLGRTAEQAQREFHELNRTVRNMTLEDGTPVFQGIQSQEDLADRVLQAKQETGRKLGQFREDADAVFEKHPELAPDANYIADRIQKELVDPLANHPLSASRAQAAPIQQLVDDIRSLTAPKFEAALQDDGRKLVQPKGETSQPTVAELTKLRQGLDDQIYQAKRGVNLTQQGAPPQLKDLERARGILEESIEASTDKAAQYFEKPAAQSYKQIKTQWRQLNLASEISGAAKLQDVGNRVISPSDYGVGAAAAVATGGAGALLHGAFATAAHHALREHASSMFAVLADKLANTLDGKIDSGLGAFFSEAAKRANVGSVADKAGTIAKSIPLKRAVTPTAVKLFQGRHEDLPTAYQSRVDEILSVNRDNGAGIRGAMQGAMGGAYGATPQLTQAATVTATRGAAWLATQIPGGTRAPTVFRPSQRTAPSDLEIRTFAQKWAAVSNPLSVLDDLRKGQVTHDQIEAIKNVYPELYGQIQQTALEKIRDFDARGKSLPFQDRLQLDLFLDLGGAGEPTLAGKFIDRIASLQAAKAQKQAQQKPQGGGGALAKIGSSLAPSSDALNH